VVASAGEQHSAVAQRLAGESKAAAWRRRRLLRRLGVSYQYQWPRNKAGVIEKMAKAAAENGEEGIWLYINERMRISDISRHGDQHHTKA